MLHFSIHTPSFHSTLHLPFLPDHQEELVYRCFVKQLPCSDSENTMLSAAKKRYVRAPSNTLLTTIPTAGTVVGRHNNITDGVGVSPLDDSMSGTSHHHVDPSGNPTAGLLVDGMVGGKGGVLHAASSVSFPPSATLPNAGWTADCGRSVPRVWTQPSGSPPSSPDSSPNAGDEDVVSTAINPPTQCLGKRRRRNSSTGVDDPSAITTYSFSSSDSVSEQHSFSPPAYRGGKFFRNHQVSVAHRPKVTRIDYKSTNRFLCPSQNMYFRDSESESSFRDSESESRKTNNCNEQQHATIQQLPLRQGFSAPHRVPIPRHKPKKCPKIITIPSFPKPKSKTIQTPQFTSDHPSLPSVRDCIVTYESMGNKFLLSKEPLESKGITSLISFSKG